MKRKTQPSVMKEKLNIRQRRFCDLELLFDILLAIENSNIFLIGQKKDPSGENPAI